jgi:2-polyprenyl-3-methyl-5-hydroxy-6-metoxy-1,4-benzoquinol methylase
MGHDEWDNKFLGDRQEGSLSLPFNTIAPNNSASCLLCGADAKFQFQKVGEQYFHCDCGFTFIWPRPSEQELRNAYIKLGEEYWTAECMMNVAFSPTKFLREMRFVRRFVAKGALLDVGCSTGSFVKTAQETGFEAEGIDISVPAVRFGQGLGLNLQAFDVLHEQPSKKYDVVTMWATLEHLSDPRGYVQRARKLLMPDGLLFVSVPNYAGIAQKLLGNWDRYVGNGHLNYFTPKVLQQAVTAEGFSVQGVTTYAFNPLLIFKDWKNRGKYNIATDHLLGEQKTILRLKHSPLLHVQRCMERVLNLFSAGDVVAVCARRMG